MVDIFIKPFQKRHKAEVNRAEISRALEGKDPSELTVRQLLKISRNIKKKGRANSDTEDEGEGVKVKEEGSDDDDDWKESEIIGQIEEVGYLYFYSMYEYEYRVLRILFQTLTKN